MSICFLFLCVFAPGNNDLAPPELARKRKTAMTAFAQTTKRSDERKSQIYLFTCMQHSGDFFPWLSPAGGFLPGSHAPHQVLETAAHSVPSSDPRLCRHSVDPRPTEWVKKTRLK